MSIRARLTLFSGLILAVLALGALPSTSEAQFGKRLKDAVKRTAEDKAIQKATTEESKAIDGAMEGGGEAKADTAAAGGAAATTGAAAGSAAAPSAATPAVGAGAAAPAATAAPPKAAGEGAFVSFDFVPGDRVLFYDDYAGDDVGDFPRRFEFAEGNAEIADWESAKWLRVSKSTKFAIVMPEVLPDRFTVEFDYVSNNKASSGWPILVNTSGAKDNWQSQGNSNPTARFGTQEGGVYSGKIEASGPAGGDFQNKVNRARIMADGKYTKLYINGVRVANGPNADMGRTNTVQFWIPVYDQTGASVTLLGPVRIAAGGKKLYDALAEKGRVATQGIYFDTGSDAIRQESAPTLKEIGTMLKDHADLKLTIEGHTDNVGKAESNQALSEKRAAAVRQYLIDNFQIDGGRLEAKGLGQTSRRVRTTRRKAANRTGGWSWSRNSARGSHAGALHSGAGELDLLLPQCLRFRLQHLHHICRHPSFQLLELRGVHLPHLLALRRRKHRRVDPAEVRSERGGHGREVAPDHLVALQVHPGRRRSRLHGGHLLHAHHPGQGVLAGPRFLQLGPRLLHRGELGGHALFPPADVVGGDRRTGRAGGGAPRRARGRRGRVRRGISRRLVVPRASARQQQSGQQTQGVPNGSACRMGGLLELGAVGWWEGLEYREGAGRRPASADHQNGHVLLEPPAGSGTDFFDRAALGAIRRGRASTGLERQMVEGRTGVPRVLGDEIRQRPGPPRRRLGDLCPPPMALQLPNDSLPRKSELCVALPQVALVLSRIGQSRADQVAGAASDP